MLVDIDAVFDDLQGYEFYNLTEISAVIADKAKCLDGSVLDFMEEVDFLISEGDEILVLRRRDSLKDLEAVRDYMRSNGDSELDDYFERKMAVAEKEGYSVSYAAVVNDQVFSVYKFSL